MVIASWRKKFNVLAEAGTRACRNCHHETTHWLVEARKEARLYFVPVAKFGKRRFLLCEVCQFQTPVTPEAASRVVQQALEPSVMERLLNDPQQAAQLRGAIGRSISKCFELWRQKYGPEPWTLETMDRGLRSELAETLYRSTVTEIVNELNVSESDVAETVRQTTDSTARKIRASAAVAAIPAEAQESASSTEQVINCMLSAVMGELGVSEDEAAQVVMEIMNVHEGR